MKSIKDKLVESKIVMEHKLKNVADNYYAVKPLLTKYESLYGQTNFSKGYINEHCEKWARQIQEGE